MTVDPLGVHLILDLYDCDHALLDDEEAIEKALDDAVKAARVTPVLKKIHRFAPQGVSGVVVIEESHLSIHTWPERNYAAVDIYTCGDHTAPSKAAESLIAALKCARPVIIKIDRGLFPTP